MDDKTIDDAADKATGNSMDKFADKTMGKATYKPTGKPTDKIMDKITDNDKDKAIDRVIDDIAAFETGGTTKPTIVDDAIKLIDSAPKDTLDPFKEQDDFSRRVDFAEEHHPGQESGINLEIKGIEEKVPENSGSKGTKLFTVAETPYKGVMTDLDEDEEKGIIRPDWSRDSDDEDILPVALNSSFSVADINGSKSNQDSETTVSGEEKIQTSDNVEDETRPPPSLETKYIPKRVDTSMANTSEHLIPSVDMMHQASTDANKEEEDRLETALDDVEVDAFPEISANILPYPWQAIMSSKGDIYYYNPDTKVSTWVRPSNKKEKSLESVRDEDKSATKMPSKDTEIPDEYLQVEEKEKPEQQEPESKNRQEPIPEARQESELEDKQESEPKLEKGQEPVKYEQNERQTQLSNQGQVYEQHGSRTRTRTQSTQYNESKDKEKSKDVREERVRTKRNRDPEYEERPSSTREERTQARRSREFEDENISKRTQEERARPKRSREVEDKKQRNTRQEYEDISKRIREERVRSRWSREPDEKERLRSVRQEDEAVSRPVREERIRSQWNREPEEEEQTRKIREERARLQRNGELLDEEKKRRLREERFQQPPRTRMGYDTHVYREQQLNQRQFYEGRPFYSPNQDPYHVYREPSTTRDVREAKQAGFNNIPLKSKTRIQHCAEPARSYYDARPLEIERYHQMPFSDVTQPSTSVTLVPSSMFTPGPDWYGRPVPPMREPQSGLLLGSEADWHREYGPSTRQPPRLPLDPAGDWHGRPPPSFRPTYDYYREDYCEQPPPPEHFPQSYPSYVSHPPYTSHDWPEEVVEGARRVVYLEDDDIEPPKSYASAGYCKDTRDGELSMSCKQQW
ncbi:hypothetical protein DFQ28_003922 [Apophysomyces sp. BC1034]|nr:hypothetical protein DFQ29_009885 [Apophysomyces sp. BC1021]KAG0169124.1 hypothetical protein DFQ30_003943 [Apophysomyces sp. BC1015]KAG0189074.1 hypothetical protein DFQ28_003922 [Apophysomyces sp. BC1034]